MEKDYKQSVRERILDSENFVRAVFSGQQKGSSVQWNKVTMRPVEIKGKLNLQFSHFDDKQDITKNYPFSKAASKVDKLLALPFRNIFIESGAGNLQVNFSKKGKPLVRKSKPSLVVTDLSHDRHKDRFLSPENAAPFLQAIGILTQDGRIKADMQRKYKQINEFLRLVDETASFSDWADSPLHVVDFGCGSGHLTFAMYYYLREVLRLDVHVTGVDIKSELLKQLQAKSEAMGWDGLKFQVGTITDYESDVPPDIVIALHACDTATDDAIAKGIQWESKVIICAPCCQHELQSQLSKVPIPSQMLPVYQDGILSERMGDILTDTFRATILRIMGYRTDVTQFVPIEHTAKNLMVRSVKTKSQGNERWMEEYRNLKSFWKVTPYLEKLLAETHANLF
ncbi:MAG TPA: SAM-dependent methyltransferase [Anaerolineales bacterium]|nr:SAM-dependent methyltransferase [Anaerolineales bacterium]